MSVVCACVCVCWLLTSIIHMLTANVFSIRFSRCCYCVFGCVCVWLCVSLCVCVCVMCFFIYTFHLLSFWALQSQRRHLPGTPLAISLPLSLALSVCVNVCVSLCWLPLLLLPLPLLLFVPHASLSPLTVRPLRPSPASIIVLFVRDHGLWSVQCSMFMAFTRTHSTSSAPLPPLHTLPPRPLAFTFCPQPLTMARWAKRRPFLCSGMFTRRAASFKYFFSHCLSRVRCPLPAVRS